MTAEAAPKQPLTLEEVQERVAAGIVWLNEHDPMGAFHFWFTSGITARSALPGQNEDRRADWIAYYNARRLWEDLWSRMERLERAAAKEGTTP